MQVEKWMRVEASGIRTAAREKAPPADTSRHADRAPAPAPGSALRPLHAAARTPKQKKMHPLWFQNAPAPALAPAPAVLLFVLLAVFLLVGLTLLAVVTYYIHPRGFALPHDFGSIPQFRLELVN